MKKLDQPTARALVALRNLPEFQTYQRWLEQSLAETDETLRGAEGVQLQRAQGRAQCLVAQLDRIENAKDIALKFEHRSG